MADYSDVINMLQELQQRVEAIKDELGRMQALDEQRVGTVPLRLSGIAPTSPDLEIMGGQETNRFLDCCAVGDDDRFCCTGTLIARNVVVTADHCRGITRVFFGSDVKEGGVIVRVVHQYAHPEVDLRVLVLEEGVTTAPRYVARGAEIGNPITATVVGFGTIDQDGQIGYGRKRMAEVPVVSLDGTEPGAQKNFGCNPGWELVAGHRGLAMDSCCGDSGGPLYIQLANGEHALLGATSRGVRNAFTTCGDGGVYVRVDRCLDWIQNVTGVQLPGANG